MKAEPSLLQPGALVRLYSPGPLWRVQTSPRLREGVLEVAIWCAERGGKVSPVSRLTLVSPSPSVTTTAEKTREDMAFGFKSCGEASPDGEVFGHDNQHFDGKDEA